MRQKCIGAAELPIAKRALRLLVVEGIVACAPSTILRFFNSSSVKIKRRVISKCDRFLINISIAYLTLKTTDIMISYAVNHIQYTSDRALWSILMA